MNDIFRVIRFSRLKHTKNCNQTDVVLLFSVSGNVSCSVSRGR